MSEIIYYEPNENTCPRCWGTVHIQKTVYKKDEGLTGYILIVHCPDCGGYGTIPRGNLHPDIQYPFKS